MDYFPLLANLLAVIAIVTGLAIGAWWIIGLYSLHTRREEKELPEVELPANLHEVFTGIPAVLWIFYAFIAISSIAYVLYIWLVRGVSY
ncbi:MAG: hypothetical protein Q7N50_07980 [Armatimonadota bacterium]|nr:hypothetical protein [Armatimonadota bacterium]